MTGGGDPAASAGADPAEPLDGTSHVEDAHVGTVAGPVLAEPGPPLDRSAPYLRGLLLGLGLLTALLIGRVAVDLASTLMLVVVAFFLACGLNPVVLWLERRGLARGPAVAAVVVAFLAALALFVVALVPVLTDQVTALTENTPGWLNRLAENDWVRQVDEDYGVLDKVREYVSQGDFVSTLFGGAVGIGLAVLGALLNAFLVIVLTLYFLASLESVTSALYRLAPASRRARVASLGDRVVLSIGGYVAGAFVVALAAGLSSLGFLLAVGLAEYAVALAFVVAVLDVIPMIGATLGAVVVTAIGFATDVQVGLACVVFYVVYQQVENYLIYPRVMRRSVDVPGVVTVLAALVGTAVLGVVGALLAIPTAAAVLMIVREVWVRAQDER